MSISGASTGLTIQFIRNINFPGAGTAVTAANTNFYSTVPSISTFKYGVGSPS
ncbi:MAG: hypothetical protein E6248_14675 [Clostridium sp.]|uniref:hypothetical protein n=1 Tax=Clostridium sp. TaxID=1506 RepID=UPI0029086710|nr:hypothetical protein [Clostridium sp.]MDU5111684.1 hypothetical protein [Clostridium sp.]